MLKHLILRTDEGLSNRIRAIASARRLCSRLGARLTVVWDWGDPTALFESDHSIEWASDFPASASDALTVRHASSRHAAGPRTVPVSADETAVLFSHYVFQGDDEPARISLADLKPWLPKPADAVLAAVAAFAGKNFRRTVGMHIRRTDHEAAIKDSPDALFMQKARELVAEGHTIFLATDNDGTLSNLKREFGEAIIVYPKKPGPAERWPRPFDLERTVEDMTELRLLAACDFVVGTAHSSFSELAILCNGSPASVILKK